MYKVNICHETRATVITRTELPFIPQVGWEIIFEDITGLIYKGTIKRIIWTLPLAEIDLYVDAKSEYEMRDYD